ncbi:helix-turn-helix domain-containing protein [Aquimarina sp. 2201CG5-10]|uniref:helix-turn-helix domain-containing protein n=1 Tax=Aquimarina callyspongiae TaxID=3098150 RepID=UPI002AB4F86A|nr:helix-turn-helix domain-containing protein [Aquimarina sp. 2201CG5-10]MDY8138769.1 helix-turn-helix domain-containing protein [Aquimarina sp. 2201CG5-10]
MNCFFNIIRFYVFKGVIGEVPKIGSCCFIYLLVISNCLLAQNIDFSRLESYQEPQDFILDPKTREAIQCEKQKLLKAQKEKDTSNIISGYYYLGSIYDGEKYLSYMDTVLTLTAGKKSYEYIRALTYTDLYLYYMDEYDYVKAMNYLVKAKDYAVLLNNDQLLRFCKEDLVTIKANFGKIQEAIDFYKEDIKRLKKDTVSIDNNINLGYHYSNISYYLTMIKKYDSAHYYNKMGKKIVKGLDSSLYRYLEINAAITDYYLGNLEAAKQVFENLETTYGDLSIANYAEIHYYLGKTNKDLGNHNVSYYHFKKIDSLYEKRQKMDFGYRDTYYELMNMHSKNEYEKRLEYVNKLLVFDSIYRVNANYVNSKVLDKFDIPTLIEEKELLITSLSKDNRKFKTKSFWYLGVGVLIFILLGYQTYSIFRYKQKARKLVIDLDGTLINKKKITKKTVSPGETLDISDEVITRTLSLLDKFEEELGFLNANLTLQQLARKVNSNSKYLSRIIKMYKEESFYGYIQNLRINQVLNRLKNDTKFREFTIDAIAKESGYNQRESFSKAFEKVTGVRPSYFIKELKKQDEKSI